MHITASMLLAHACIATIFAFAIGEEVCTKSPSPHVANLTNAARDYLDQKDRGVLRISFESGGTIQPVGSYSASTREQACAADAYEQETSHRRERVKEAVIHAWDGYARWAWGYDELQPVSRDGKDTFASGLGTTIVDSLSTLYMMGGLDGRYERAREWVATQLQFSKVGRVIVFETVIRILGGLVSMYHLSGDEMFLEKAEELGVRLAASFETPTGLPWPRCYLNDTGNCELHNVAGDLLYLAEVGSVQLEFRALAHHSTQPLVRSLRAVAERVIQELQTAESFNARLAPPHEALLPFALSLSSGRYSTNLVTLGAPADSYFEYLVKVWVQGGRREIAYWHLFASVVDSMVQVAMYTSRHGDMIVRELLPGRDGGLQYSHKMDHFSCYIPGMIVLGVDGLGDDEVERREQWMQLAEGLTETCYKMYTKSPSGLSGEHIRLGEHDEWRMSGGYQLRPEAVEAFFYMWRHTGKRKYREYAWSVFTNMEHHCREESGGYSALKTARSRNPKKENVMHSFVISETFKYIWLTLSDDDVLPLDEWVLNTEAHPLLITPALADEDAIVVGERIPDDSKR